MLPSAWHVYQMTSLNRYMENRCLCDLSPNLLRRECPCFSVLWLVNEFQSRDTRTLFPHEMLSMHFGKIWNVNKIHLLLMNLSSSLQVSKTWFFNQILVLNIFLSLGCSLQTMGSAFKFSSVRFELFHIFYSWPWMHCFPGHRCSCNV